MRADVFGSDTLEPTLKAIISRRAYINLIKPTSSNVLHKHSQQITDERVTHLQFLRPVLHCPVGGRDKECLSSRESVVVIHMNSRIDPVYRYDRARRDRSEG